MGRRELLLLLRRGVACRMDVDDGLDGVEDEVDDVEGEADVA